MNRKKAFVLPIVLILFSVVFIIFLSSYRRYLLSYNTVNVKRESLKRKLETESLESFLKTKKFVNYINLKLENPKNIVENIFLTDIFYKEIVKNFKEYSLKLKAIQSLKDSIFTNKNVKVKFDRDFISYDIFVDVLKNKKTYGEYKIVDKKNIFQYLWNLQFSSFVKNQNENIFKENFYIKDLSKNYLYKNIFNKNTKNYIFENIRIFNFENEIFFIENEKFLHLLEKYISNSKIELKKLDVSNFSLHKLDELFRLNNEKNLTKDEFLKQYLLKNSKVILDKKKKREIFNFEFDEIIFDFDREMEIYSNFKNNDKVKVLNKTPTIKGIFVNLKDVSDINLEGLYFGENLKINYKFTPQILNIVIDNIKISDDYFLEKINVN